MWPNISSILEKIHFYLPRIPKVTVTLFREDHPHLTRDNDNDVDENF